MDKKFWISVVVAFVIAMGGAFLVHEMLLKSDYAQISNLMRTEADAQNYFPFMLGAHVIYAIAFAWIYRQGVSSAPWLTQGIRYGVAVALLTTFPMFLIYYSVQPTPGILATKQIVFDSVVTVINGIAMAFINKSSESA
jgi:hypothetical protein